jgi:hypothetical protein
MKGTQRLLKVNMMLIMGDMEINTHQSPLTKQENTNHAKTAKLPKLQP